MQGSASLSLCARRQPKRWWVVQWKNSESTDILEVVFQVAQENENHLKRLHSNDSIDLLTYMMDFGDGIMASVEIPSIGVDLPVRHGADSYALDNGLGHLHGTSLPVGGTSTHSVITGHTGVADKALFTRLTELRKGDVFYVKVAAQTLAYKVTRIRKVDPDDLRSVRVQPGRDLVTLVTCTPIFLNTYRLLVTGERVSMPDDAPYPEDAPRTSGRDTRPYLVSGVTLLAGLPAAIVASRPKARPFGRHGRKD